MKSGAFITFEGGEGTGKSTQARRLTSFLLSRGDDVVLTREPGGTPAGEIVRHLVLAGAAEPLGPFAEAVLMNAARLDHLNSVIRPALKDGKVVICDRFSDSTLAYQGLVGGVDLAVLKQMESAILEQTRPDLTIVMDAPVKTTLARARQASGASKGGLDADRFERQNSEVHEALRHAFLKLAKAAPKRMRVVDATGSEEAVWKRVQRVFDAFAEAS